MCGRVIADADMVDRLFKYIIKWHMSLMLVDAQLVKGYYMFIDCNCWKSSFHSHYEDVPHIMSMIVIYNKHRFPWTYCTESVNVGPLSEQQLTHPWHYGLYTKASFISPQVTGSHVFNACSFNVKLLIRIMHWVVAPPQPSHKADTVLCVEHDL